MSEVIIKQRPQRATPNGTATHFDAAHEDEPQPRGTAAPGAAGMHSHPRERSPALESTGARERSGYAADEGGEAAAPPTAAKTARPAMKEGKGKKKAAKAEAEAAPAPSKKKSKKAKAGQEAAAPEAAPRAAPALKKNARRVNILTVQEDAPIPEGVNTPRSVALCEKHGIKPMELRPRTLRDFQNHAVKTDLAELRFNSYEKRRKAHMALLLPKRKRIQRRIEEEKAAAEVASKEQSRARERERSAQRTRLPRSYIGNARPEGESAQPGDNGSDVDEETRAMQRQFDEQHNRILEQERRQASANRGSTPRARRSPSHSGTSPRNYHASVSRSSGVGLPPSAAKIQSRSKTENRELYEGERIAIEEIIERDLYVQEIRERQAMLEENRQLMLVEERLQKEKAAAERLQRINDERDLEKERKHMERKNRDEIAQERRLQAEEERQRKIADEMAEKEARIHATDPYASALSRRRYSTARSDRRRSSARGISAPNAAAYEEYEQHHDE